MADVSIWWDKDARAAFIAKGREAFERIKGELEGQDGAVIVAIEPESGDHFSGSISRAWTTQRRRFLCQPGEVGRSVDQ